MSTQPGTAPIAALIMLDHAAVVGRINAFAKTAKEMDQEVHTLAVQTLLHASGKGSGDTSLAVMLLNAMPKSGRPEALRKWFSTFSPMFFVVDTETGETMKAKLRKASDKQYRNWDVPKANSTPFWKLNPEVQAPLTLKQLVAMATGVAKRLEAAETETDDKPARGYIGDKAKALAFAAAVAKAAEPFLQQAEDEAKEAAKAPKAPKATGSKALKPAPIAAKANGKHHPAGDQPTA